MDLVFLQDFLNIYAWLAASMIMVFLAGIALFYQKNALTKIKVIHKPKNR